MVVDGDGDGGGGNGAEQIMVVVKGSNDVD